MAVVVAPIWNKITTFAALLSFAHLACCDHRKAANQAPPPSRSGIWDLDPALTLDTAMANCGLPDAATVRSRKSAGPDLNVDVSGPEAFNFSY